ncbi:MAG: WD40 repeat domain-containing protein [Pirellulales bacterium]
MRSRLMSSRRSLLILLAPLLAVLAWLVSWQRNPITHLAFSPDGSMLATSTDAGNQGAVGVWNLASGGSVFSTTTHAQISGLQFSPDGATLATSDRDGSIQIWHVLAWALVWALPLAVGRIRGFDAGQIWELTIAELAMFASLAVALKLARAGRRRRTVSEGAAVPRQFFLKDLVIWTAAAGVLLGVARHLSPGVQPPILTAFEAVGGASLGIACATAYWAAGSRLPIALRLFVLFAVAVAAGSATEPFRAFIGLHPWWWYVAINITAASCVADAWLIFRLHRDRFTGEGCNE